MPPVAANSCSVRQFFCDRASAALVLRYTTAVSEGGLLKNVLCTIALYLLCLQYLQHDLLHKRAKRCFFITFLYARTHGLDLIGR